ncbi:hypothetical protein J6590_078397 [Homalodisca vitripennis]|nr:hypothetical protein J6590_078397 [Homalodisca vitripennis]
MKERPGGLREWRGWQLSSGRGVLLICLFTSLALPLHPRPLRKYPFCPFIESGLSHFGHSLHCFNIDYVLHPPIEHGQATGKPLPSYWVPARTSTTNVLYPTIERGKSTGKLPPSYWDPVRTSITDVLFPKHGHSKATSKPLPSYWDPARTSTTDVLYPPMEYGQATTILLLGAGTHQVYRYLISTQGTWSSHQHITTILGFGAQQDYRYLTHIASDTSQICILVIFTLHIDEYISYM